jgi:two-component system OmpR family sensor kinase
MRTIRARLAVGYAALLGATILVFGSITYMVQGSRPFDDTLDTRVSVESNLIAGILGEAYRARDSVVTVDPLSRDLVLIPAVAVLLEGVPGYVVVLGRNRHVLAMSPDARDLPIGPVEGLIDAAQGLEARLRPSSTDLGVPVGRVRFFVRPIVDAGDEVTAVVSAVPAVHIWNVPLLTAMLWTAPFVIAASLLVGFSLVGRHLRPVETIVDEIEAITDGRSLHRRVPSLKALDELARLTSTLNQMLGRLERSFGTLRRFTADASHELKTPLTVLRTGIERSITHPETPPEVMETLEETLFEVNRMTEMVDSLLTLARVDEGRAPLHLDDVDLREVLAELAETANILGEQAAVQVAVQVPAEAVPMKVDRSRIRQLLTNLLTNAIKYTSAGGTVDIESALDGARVVLTVRDTGMGIAPGDLPHIFDRFWRADAARSRTGSRPGSGLGLAISKWIAEAHGGTITVRSRPGRGTTFTVSLPLDPPE